MTSNDVYERLGILEQLVQHLYEKTGVPTPDLRALSRTQVSPAVQRLVASGNTIEAIKVPRRDQRRSGHGEADHRVLVTLRR